MTVLPKCRIPAITLAAIICLFAVVHGRNASAQSPAPSPLKASPKPPDAKSWVNVIEDERSIKIETDLLEAVIAKNNPKQ